MQIKDGDFVEIDFTAKDRETNKIFDTTEEAEAKANNIYNEKSEYNPIVICIGENQILKGLDEFLVDKETKKEYEVELSPEKAFGKKDPKLIKIIPSKEFKKQKIHPFPGLQLKLDDSIGTIRAVSGGRIIVDFNYPLAGHTLIYKIKIKRVIREDKEKIESLLRVLNLRHHVSIKEGTTEISAEIPLPFQKGIAEKIKRLVPKIKEVKFNSPNKNN